MPPNTPLSYLCSASAIFNHVFFRHALHFQKTKNMSGENLRLLRIFAGRSSSLYPLQAQCHSIFTLRFYQCLSNVCTHLSQSLQKMKNERKKLIQTLMFPMDLVKLNRCKRLNSLGLHSLVLSKASHKTFLVKPQNWCDSVHRFLKHCADAGNIEACYTLGMVR